MPAIHPHASSRAHRRPVAAGPLLALWLLAPAALAAPSQAELEQLRQRIGVLQAELTQARGEQDRERQRLREVETQIGNLHRNRARIERELATQSKRLAGLERDYAAQERAIAGQRQALAAQVRAAYGMGRQEQLKIVLNQEDPSRLGRMLGYYGYFNRARLERIQAIDAAQQRLRAVEAEVLAEQERLVELQARHQASAAALADERAAREELLATLAGRIESQDRELARSRADEERLVKLLGSLQQALDDLTDTKAQRQPFAGQRGKLAWPARGSFTARYGRSRGVGGLRWQGVVIGAEEGGEVRAVSHGRVAFADWLRGYGLLVILDHGDGYMSLYGYNQALNKEVGDWVEGGEPIASVGRSGGNAQAGLYFEIRHRGRPVDPERWCRAGSRRGTG